MVLLHVSTLDAPFTAWSCAKVRYLVFSARCILGNDLETKNPTGYLTFVAPYTKYTKVACLPANLGHTKRIMCWCAIATRCLVKAIHKNAAQPCRYRSTKKLALFVDYYSLISATHLPILTSLDLERSLGYSIVLIGQSFPLLPLTISPAENNPQRPRWMAPQLNCYIQNSKLGSCQNYRL